MSDTPGSLTRHAAAAACLLMCVLVGASASAQDQPGPQPLSGPSKSPDFLTRSDFQLSGVALAIDDQRFAWDTHFGGAIDVVDYVYGRASIVADYEAVLGSEFRPFDPNQGNYILETSGSVWAGTTEVAGVFHHVSRHISDRPKRYAIAWNVLGARVLQQVVAGDTTIGIRAGLGRVVAHADVDYQWTADIDLVVRHPVAPRVSVFGRGRGELFGVDPALRGRQDTQRGGRLEGGLRIEGRGGAIELFAGIEQRADADPHDYVPLRWALAGFRLVSR